MCWFWLTRGVSRTLLHYLLYIRSTDLLDLLLAVLQALREDLVFGLLVLYRWARKLLVARTARAVALRLLLVLILVVDLLLLDAAMRFVIHGLCISQLVAHHVEVRLQRVKELDHLFCILSSVLALVFFLIRVGKLGSLVDGWGKGRHRHFVARGRPRVGDLGLQRDHRGGRYARGVHVPGLAASHLCPGLGEDQLGGRFISVQEDLG